MLFRSRYLRPERRCCHKVTETSEKQDGRHGQASEIANHNRSLARMPAGHRVVAPGNASGEYAVDFQGCDVDCGQGTDRKNLLDSSLAAERINRGGKDQNAARHEKIDAGRELQQT